MNRPLITISSASHWGPTEAVFKLHGYTCMHSAGDFNLHFADDVHVVVLAADSARAELEDHLQTAIV